MDNILRIALYRQGTIKSIFLGDINLDIMKDIIERDYPQYEWYILKKDNKNTVKICVSFHRMETIIDDNDSPLVRQAIINAARKAASKGETFTKSYDDMTDQEKLTFLSGVLEGPLQLMKFKGWITYYFKAIEKRGKWFWCYWASKNDMTDGSQPIGKISLLSISLILPDSHNRQQFYVKYHTVNGPQDLFLRRVERDRDIWSNGLYEFIERLREFIEEQKHNPKPIMSVSEDTKKLPTSQTNTVESVNSLKEEKAPTNLYFVKETTKKMVPDSIVNMIENSRNSAKKKSTTDYPLIAIDTQNSLKQIFEGPL